MKSMALAAFFLASCVTHPIAMTTTPVQSVQNTPRAGVSFSDEMAMSSAASQMTPEELAHIVAYLRNPAGK
jgi:hypothetical protein